MTTRLTEYIESGKALDADEREVAALALQHVDEVEQAQVDTDWDRTVTRRLDEALSGETPLVEGRDGIARIRAELAARRP